MPQKVRLTRRKNPARRNPAEDELPEGEWIPAAAVRFNEDGTTDIITAPAEEDTFENPGQEVTDRALRYRANAEPPPGERICAFCGSKTNVEVGHIDGHEENGEPENLIWNCRRCNTQMGVAFKRAGLGRRTRQYNPAEGAKSLGQWLTAVMSMKGQGDMSVSDAVAMIHATSPHMRSAFAREIWQRRRGRRSSEVPF